MTKMNTKALFHVADDFVYQHLKTLCDELYLKRIGGTEPTPKLKALEDLLAADPDFNGCNLVQMAEGLITESAVAFTMLHAGDKTSEVSLKKRLVLVVPDSDRSRIREIRDDLALRFPGSDFSLSAFGTIDVRGTGDKQDEILRMFRHEREQRKVQRDSPIPEFHTLLRLWVSDKNRYKIHSIRDKLASQFPECDFSLGGFGSIEARRSHTLRTEISQSFRALND